MRILVTGNLGFVGSVLTNHLQDLGHTVLGLDTGFFKDCIATQPREVSQQIMADVRKLTELPPTDAVVHLAALSNDPLGELNATVTHDINVDGSLNVARIAKAQGIRRFIFASSCSMYGVSESGIVNEDSEQNPQTAYARSKVIAENEILRMADAVFCPISFRFATAYGFSPRPRLDIVVNNLIASAITRKELVLESDGTPWRPLIHVKDMARAIVAGFDTDLAEVGGKAFNVGCDEENHQVRGIAKLVSDALGGLPLRIGAARGADTRSYRVAFDKFSLAFPHGLPQERLSKAATGLAAQYSAMLRPDEYDGTRFFRLRQIKHLIDSGLLDHNLCSVAAVSQ